MTLQLGGTAERHRFAPSSGFSRTGKGLDLDPGRATAWLPLNLKRLRSNACTLCSAACGNITTGWKATVVIDVLYAGLGILMIACLWFIDRTLKDDGD